MLFASPRASSRIKSRSPCPPWIKSGWKFSAPLRVLRGSKAVGSSPRPSVPSVDRKQLDILRAPSCPFVNRTVSVAPIPVRANVYAPCSPARLALHAQPAKDSTVRKPNQRPNPAHPLKSWDLRPGHLAQCLLQPSIDSRAPQDLLAASRPCTLLTRRLSICLPGERLQCRP